MLNLEIVVDLCDTGPASQVKGVWLAWLDKLFCHVPLCQSVNKTVFLGLQLHKLKALFCFGHMIVLPCTPAIQNSSNLFLSSNLFFC